VRGFATAPGRPLAHFVRRQVPVRASTQDMVTAPTIETMASGNLSLRITNDITWESFPSKAQEFVARFNGKVLRRMDTPVERMWIVLIRLRPFWLTFDDYPLGLTLDSMSRFCNVVVRQLHRELGGTHDA